MTPRTPKQLEELKQAKRTLILEAALTVFSEQGYNGTSIMMIAEKAGISKGLLYTYFKSKEDLLHKLIEYGLNRMAEYFKVVPEQGIADKKDFEHVVRGMFSLYRSEEDFWRLYIMLILQKNIAPQFKELFQGMMKEFVNIFSAYFKKKNCPDPKTEAMLFGATLDGIMLDMTIIPGVFPVEDMINIIVKKFA